MITLNNLYNKNCRPSYTEYQKLTDNIVLIDNFFENFNESKNFFTKLDKWKCVIYQKHDKPGYESILPPWIGKSLLEKYILDNKIIDDLYSYLVTCNFFYETYQPWSLGNSGSIPHVDCVSDNDEMLYICLINLNNVPIETNFYSYKNKNFCSYEMKKDWDDYLKELNKEVFEYSFKSAPSHQQIKKFLEEKKDLKISLVKKIKYKPNQAIIYPSNLFHSAEVPSYFTEENPRIVLRIGFVRKYDKLIYE